MTFPFKRYKGDSPLHIQGELKGAQDPPRFARYIYIYTHSAYMLIRFNAIVLLFF